MNSKENIIGALRDIGNKAVDAVFDNSEIGSKAGRHNPVVSLSRGGLSVEKGYEKFIGERGWGGVFSLEAWKRFPLSTGAMFLNIFHGVGMEVARKSAAKAVAMFTGREDDTTCVGLVEAVGADKESNAKFSVKVPVDGGGFERREFSVGKIDDIREFCSLLGRGVEVARAGGGKHTLIRQIAGETALGKGVGVSRLSVYEIAAVVDAQASGHDFSGEWTRRPIPGAGKGSILPPELAGLYVHNETKQGILVFRGTRALSGKDWGTNVAFTHGVVGRQYSMIEGTVRAAENETSGLFAAGYSKGGGMAQFAAIKTGVRAVTFNSVGIPGNLAKEGTDAKVSHYVTRYDWVSNMSGGKRGEGGGISGPVAVARGLDQTLLGGKGDIHVLRSTRNRYKFLDMHSMEMVKKGLVLEPKFITRPFEGGVEPQAGLGEPSRVQGRQTRGRQTNFERGGR